MTTTSSIKELLKKRNLKVTELRMALLEIISSLGKAISYQEIQNSLINFDRITLYRTLNTFIERGILHKIILEDHQSFYALCSIECSTEGHSISMFIFNATNAKKSLVLRPRSRFSWPFLIILWMILKLRPQGCAKSAITSN